MSYDFSLLVYIPYKLIKLAINRIQRDIRHSKKKPYYHGIHALHLMKGLLPCNQPRICNYINKP